MRQSNIKKNIKAWLDRLGLLNSFFLIKDIINLGWMFLKRKKRLTQIFNLYRHLRLRYLPTSSIHFSPKTLSLVLTQKCNLHCSMCLTHSESTLHSFSLPKDMSFKLFKEIITRYNDVETVLFIGNGEPLLHPDVFKMIEYCRDQKIDTLLVTNGTLLSRYKSELIQARPSSIFISINGYNEADYIRLTGEKAETYRCIRENIRDFSGQIKACNIDMFVGCSFICDQANYTFMQEMLDLTFQLGANLCVFNNYLDYEVKGFTALERCLYDTPEFRKTVEKLTTPILSNGRPMTVVLPIPLKENNPNYFCDSFFTLLRIDGDGNIGGCGRKLLELKNNGHFLDEDHWNNTYFTKHREAFLKMDGKDIHQECLTCFNSHICHAVTTRKKK